MIRTNNQFYLFTMFLLVGTAMSLVYYLTHLGAKKKWHALIADAVFGVITIIGCEGANLYINNGEFRWFVILGIAVGYIVSTYTLVAMLDMIIKKLYNLVNTKRKRTDEDFSRQKNDLRDNNSNGGVDSDAMLASDSLRPNRSIQGQGR